ncbi:MAG: Plug domain-containing protein [Chloroflexia bacterium]|nr:Plug domain-containing protein [Chloroflexia bacterium]
MDLFQSIQSIPGINSTSDGSVFFFTRGGNKDQNLILVDEAPIYHPSHLFGIVSAVSPEAINDVAIYKNYFPVQYGGRLSSIIDISIKDGNMNNFGFYGSITPITTGLNLEGPIIKENHHFTLASEPHI